MEMDRLLEATLGNDAEKVQQCLDEGTDVNLQNGYGWTALMAASNLGNLQIVDILINAGACQSPDQCWSKCQSPG